MTLDELAAFLDLPMPYGVGGLTAQMDAAAWIAAIAGATTRRRST
jgi:hypothetical protein